MRFLPSLSAILAVGLLSWFVLSTNGSHDAYRVKLGLDLAGGTELIYIADTSEVVTDKEGALNSLREVVEKRVNLFGVAEPLVQLEKSSAVAGAVEDRLIVELPGVTDLQAAVNALGKTPVLEFALVDAAAATGTDPFIATGLTGRYLKNAQLQFGNGQGGVAAGQPVIVIHFNEEGAELFERITREHTGEQLAIILDNAVLSMPVIQEAIPGGTATITGHFTPIEARDLVQNLNFGALPVPITLTGSNTVGPTLGAAAFEAGVLASIIGFALVAAFMILWYRIPGLVATLALVLYVLLTIALIKFIPITLTASGIAGFILSIGMAVDANVLIFERMKEELRVGKSPHDAAKTGFSRAWPAIRDGHFTMILSSIILFWMGTSLVQGFALVFGAGVILSLFSAVTVTQTMLNTVLPKENKGAWTFLLSSGMKAH